MTPEMCYLRQMPTLGEMKAEMERVLKDPDLQAEIYARPLRKAGLLTTGGRGLSAPQMTVTDCANLLIAIMGHSPAIRAPEAVERYRSLMLLRRPVGRRGQRSTKPRSRAELEGLPLNAIREVHYLGEALQLLLMQARDGQLEQLQSRWRRKPPERSGLSLRLIGPTPAATLRIPMLNERFVLAYAGDPSPPTDGRPGLVRAAEVYEDTILALGQMLRRPATRARAGP